MQTLVDFDDGHTPGNASAATTRLALNNGKQSSLFVSIYDDLLPPVWAERIYDYAVKRGKPWGVYVLTKDLLAIEQANERDGDGKGSVASLHAYIEGIWEADPERAFAMCATYALVLQRGRGLVGEDIVNIHGTAVWCLCSGVTNSVEYHIDYAELYRYETNIIHPPLYAGTCHVSPIQRHQQSGSDLMMRGGDFCVNTGGIEHYRRFGYKGKLQGGSDALESDLKNSPDWQTIRYKYNRGILHDGDLPHLSTPVEQLSEGLKRVIMGFNCFTSEVGECCIRAPEHSQAFNRTVKLYQAVAHATGAYRGVDSKYGAINPSSVASAAVSPPPSPSPSTNTKSAGSLSAKEVLKNPALAKLLVLAARKIKAEEAIQQQQNLGRGKTL